MTTCIKTKSKNSDDQTKIDRYKVAVNIIEYCIISKLNFLRTIIPNSWFHVNKNDNINKCKGQEIRWSDEYWLI